MIRVVVVEDSPTARALLVGILRGDPDLEVVGEARDGIEAVELTQRLRPDVVTMDIHMPRLDGFAATKEIMITAPTPIVIATGSTQTSEVEVAMHALRAGAVAVVCKPHGPTSEGFEEASTRFRATIKAMAEVKVVRRWRPVVEARPAVNDGPTHPKPGEPGWKTASLQPSSEGLAAVDPSLQGGPVGSIPLSSGHLAKTRVVAIATSTGGPAALQQLLVGLPGDFPAPLLVVQHITSGFTQGLATWLNSVCDLHVKVAEQGERLLPHTVYLAPDGRHLGVSGPGSVALDDGPPLGGFRPSGTFLFTAVARVFGAAATAIVLTGMGEDGVNGLRAVRVAGGRTFAQDEKSSVVFGMPGAAIAAGLADLVLPPEQIALRLTRMV
jgi:two-component system chemotaxis response regulator CheB